MYIPFSIGATFLDVQVASSVGTNEPQATTTNHYNLDGLTNLMKDLLMFITSHLLSN